jgi:hypothetical protein
VAFGHLRLEMSKSSAEGGTPSVSEALKERCSRSGGDADVRIGESRAFMLPFGRTRTYSTWVNGLV